MNQERVIKEVQAKLFELQDIKYQDFHAKLMPTVNKEKIIGVRDSCTSFICKRSLQN